MPNRGEPFLPERRLAAVYCPACSAILKPIFVISLGPDASPSYEQMKPPFYRYVCAGHGAAYLYLAPLLL